MAFLDRLRQLFSPSTTAAEPRGPHNLPIPRSTPPMPKIKREGPADWTQRTIDDAVKADGRAPLSAEAQAGVAREIAAAQRGSDKPDFLINERLQKGWSAANDHARTVHISDTHDEAADVRLGNAFREYLKTEGKLSFDNWQASQKGLLANEDARMNAWSKANPEAISAESQAIVNREIRAANGPVKDEIKRRSTLGEAIGAKAPAVRTPDTSHLMPPAPRPR